VKLYLKGEKVSAGRLDPMRSIILFGHQLTPTVGPENNAPVQCMYDHVVDYLQHFITQLRLRKTGWQFDRSEFLMRAKGVTN
jgi:hypothetical protein